MLRYSTPIPNRLFDDLMKDLSASAVRVYLKIARNTLGWRDTEGNFKKRDWISHSQFTRVGVSRRSVTSAIEELLLLGLIRATDELGKPLNRAEQRKHAKRIFYSVVLDSQANFTPYKAKTDKIKAKFPHTTKEILTKKYKANERIPDHMRLQQILEEEEKKQTERDSWRHL